MNSYERILFDLPAETGIARITLNRPEKRNAIDSLLIAELKQAFEAAREARVVVLSGAGKDFCSGADLSGLQKVSENGVIENMDDARQMADLFRAMRRHPRPIVAVVKGRALAGGCGLATACDIILAAESAKFGYPEVNIGFVPAMVMAILRRSVSEKRAFELIAMGEVFGAFAAREAGLVNHVFPDEMVDEESDAYIRRIAEKSMSALELCKSLLYHIDGASFDTALEAGVQINGIARMTPDCRAGIDRFLSKPRANGN
jgi:methylglutaconyl-CoA hydratase